MSFLQPWILLGLPLLALPVIIHLINQFRHRTVHWGAMQFLLSARRMNRGMARLKQILILSLRVLAVIGLIVALSRPLAGGWLGLTMGGAAETSIILLDRSASMEEQDPRTGLSKRDTGLQKVIELLEKRGGNRVVLIDSASLEPQEVEAPRRLLDLPGTTSTATHADVAAMVQRALDYMQETVLGRTDVWLITDMRTRDWTPESARWEGIRSVAQEMDTMRLYILAYPDVAEANRSVATGLVSRQSGAAEQDALVTDIFLRASGDTDPNIPVPVGITVNGTRTVIDVTLDQPEVVLQGYAIPVDKNTRQGWGRIDLPKDANPQDNAAYFVFGEAPERYTVVVSDSEQVAAPILAACSAPADSGFRYRAERFPEERANEVPWEDVSLLVWQAPLPEGVLKTQIEAFVDSGRTVIFLPPTTGGAATGEVFGVSWGEWRLHPDPEPAEISWWRTDSDILQNALNGNPLPVGQITLNRYAPVSGRATPLARVEEQNLVLAKAITEQGSAYFCGTLPQMGQSNLAREGVVFYVMLQRALSRGAESQSNARLLDTGWSRTGDQVWERLAPENDVLLSQRFYLAGAFQAEDQLVALNRPIMEDDPSVLESEAVDALLADLNYEFIQDQAGGSRALAHEVWRVLLILMALALLGEAILCLPPQRPSSKGLGGERQASGT